MLSMSCPKLVWERLQSRGAFELPEEMSDSGCPKWSKNFKSPKAFSLASRGRVPITFAKSCRIAPNLEALRTTSEFLKLQHTYMLKAPSYNTCHRIYYTVCHKSSKLGLKGLWEMVLPSISQSFSSMTLLSPRGIFCAPQANAAPAERLVWFRAPRWLTADLIPPLPKSRISLYLSCSQQMFA